MPRFEDHECFLVNKEDDDTVNQFIDSGFFITIRRRFRSWCIIYRSHPESSRYFKSHAACRNEEIRHLISYYYMVHPFSKLNLYWEFFMFVLLSIHFVLIPIDASVVILKVDNDLYLTKFIFDLLYISDIVKLFFTGYYAEETNRVVLSSSKVARRYLITYFIFDVLSCIHAITYPITLYINISYLVTIPLRIISRIKIVRLPRWLYILELFREYMGYSNYVFKGLKVVLIFLVVILWAFSFNFFIENYVTQRATNVRFSGNWNTRIYNSFYDATTKLLMISSGEHHMTEEIEYVKVILFLCFGYCLQMFVYAQIIQVWTKYASTANKHNSLNKQFEEYMRYKELPVSLRGRMSLYFKFKFHKYFFKEADINNMISPFIKQEILMHIARNHIENVDFFRYLPENVLAKVVVELKTEIYLPGDVIISAGTTGNGMFFIYRGTVAIFTPGGKEVCHLDDGTHFGEIALILSETRVANVIAVTPCELFMLRRSDFLEAIEPFPECKEQLIELATERLHKTISQGNISQAKFIDET